MYPVSAWLLVAGTVVGLAAGQVLFKVGALRINANDDDALFAWINAPIVTALVIYALSTLLWVAALRSLPLRIAYPVSALGFVLVPILGHFLLKEPLTAKTLYGAAFIIVGVAVATSDS